MIRTPKWHDLTGLEVYEPAEDTFILLDALELDLDKVKKGQLFLEVGSGSGTVITALAQTLGTKNTYFATDINPQACFATTKTAELNGVHIQVVQTDLTRGVEQLLGKVNVLIFNPPYVVTTAQEISDSLISRTWAGGQEGTEVLSRLLAYVPKLLADDGLFYLVAIDENKPENLKQQMQTVGFLGCTVLNRRIRGENLSVIRFYKG